MDGPDARAADTADAAALLLPPASLPRGAGGGGRIFGPVPAACRRCRSLPDSSRPRTAPALRSHTSLPRRCGPQPPAAPVSPPVPGAFGRPGLARAACGREGTRAGPTGDAGRAAAGRPGKPESSRLSPVPPAVATFAATPPPVRRAYHPGGGLRHHRPPAASTAESARSVASASIYSGRAHCRPAPFSFPSRSYRHLSRHHSHRQHHRHANATTRVGASARAVGSGNGRRPPRVPFAPANGGCWSLSCPRQCSGATH